MQLALGPAITALAAGNRVMLKPSELTPHTSAQLAALVGQFFAPEEFAVIEGDVSVATQFSGLHFDHLLFTGSTAVGRRVAQAAAAHLTPTTLELGGKSPCIVSTDCDLKEAALKIAHGKLVNAGQTCIAPTTCCCRMDRRPNSPRPFAPPRSGCSRALPATRTMPPSSPSATWPACGRCCARPRAWAPMSNGWRTAAPARRGGHGLG